MSRTKLNEEGLRCHEVLSQGARKDLTIRVAAGLRVSYAKAKRVRPCHREGRSALPARLGVQALAPCESGWVTGASAGIGPGRVWRVRGGWLRVDAGSGASSEQAPSKGGREHVAGVDASAARHTAVGQGSGCPNVNDSIRGASRQGRGTFVVSWEPSIRGLSRSPP